jgi:hypothetical protein
MPLNLTTGDTVMKPTKLVTYLSRIAILILIIAGIASAQDKNAPETSVYNMDGTVETRVTMMPVSHQYVISADGDTVYCGSDGSHAWCDHLTDEIKTFVTFSHDSWTTLPTPYVVVSPDRVERTDDDPLWSLAHVNGNNVVVKFRYRVAVISIAVDVDKEGNKIVKEYQYFCMPSRTQEVCYRPVTLPVQDKTK